VTKPRIDNPEEQAEIAMPKSLELKEEGLHRKIKM
jgi:hypothetical protein